MDRKIRIHFFPRDASRVRVLAVPRKLAIAIALLALPMCLLGFWLAASGALREDAPRKIERRKLERETAALGAKTEQLQEETARLRARLDSLEDVRIRVTMTSGLEVAGERAARAPETRRFRLFGDRAPEAEDFDRALRRAQRASHFMDSSLFVLQRRSDLAERLPTVWPVEASALVTRPYGPAQDPFTGRRNLHPGVDFGLAPGSPVRASGGGTVTASGNDPIWGWHVRVRHANHLETFYAHLERTGVAAGATVRRGEVIGWVGQSGASTGPHLHFEMRLWGDRVDPLLYLSTPHGAAHASL